MTILSFASASDGFLRASAVRSQPVVRFGIEDKTGKTPSLLESMEQVKDSFDHQERSAFLDEVLIEKDSLNNRSWTGRNLLQLMADKMGKKESYYPMLLIGEYFSKDNQELLANSVERLRNLGFIRERVIFAVPYYGCLYKISALGWKALGQPGAALSVKPAGAGDDNLKTKQLKALLTQYSGGISGWELLKEILKLEAGRSGWQRKMMKNRVPYRLLAEKFGTQNRAHLNNALNALQEAGYLGFTKGENWFSWGEHWSSLEKCDHLYLGDEALRLASHKTVEQLLASPLFSKADLSAVVMQQLQDYRQAQLQRQEFLGDLEKRVQAADEHLAQAQAEKARLEELALDRQDGDLALKADDMQPQLDLLGEKARQLRVTLDMARIRLDKQARQEQQEILSLQATLNGDEMMGIHRRLSELLENDPSAQIPFDAFQRELNIQAAAESAMTLGDNPEGEIALRENLQARTAENALARLQKNRGETALAKLAGRRIGDGSAAAKTGDAGREAEA